MGYRVDRISVFLEVYTEFEGNHQIHFAYVPEADDPLVTAALAKNDEMLLVAARADLNSGVGII